MTGYTPRYMQFARVRGFTPGTAEQPPMHEFISWVRGKWNQWAAHTQRKTLHPLSQQDHADFDAWLCKESA